MRIPNSFGIRLARDESSTVTVGFLMLSVTLYLLLAAVWNTGAVVDRKIQAQAIADAAALSAASQMASACNDATMLNMLQLRLRSANSVYIMCQATHAAGAVAVAGAAVYYAALIASSVFPFNPVNLAKGIRGLVYVAQDSVNLANFYSQFHKGRVDDVIKDTKINDKCKDVGKKLNENLYTAGKDIEEYVNTAEKGRFKIYLTHRKTGFYPAKAGTADYLFTPVSNASKRIALIIRFALFDGQWKTVTKPGKPPQPEDSYLRNLGGNIKKFLNIKFFELFKSEIGPVPVKYVMLTTWFISMAARIGLEPQNDWYCYAPVDDRAAHQVLAFAEVNTDADFRANTFMAPVFFHSLYPRDNLMAVAAAEVYNPYKVIIEDIPVLGTLVSVLQWTNFAAFGANYQARLTRIDPAALESALATGGNADLRKALKKNTGKEKGFGYAFLH